MKYRFLRRVLLTELREYEEIQEVDANSIAEAQEMITADDASYQVSWEYFATHAAQLEDQEVISITVIESDHCHICGDMVAGQTPSCSCTVEDNYINDQ